MQQLSWAQFDLAVATLAQRLTHQSFSGIYGVPRGGLCLAVALSHALELPYLITPQAGCLIVDDVYETGQTLTPLHEEWPDAVFAVWISKSPPEWWIAAEVFSSQEWVVFPWSQLNQASAEEQSYRQSRGMSCD